MEKITGCCFTSIDLIQDNEILITYTHCKNVAEFFIEYQGIKHVKNSKEEMLGLLHASQFEKIVMVSITLCYSSLNKKYTNIHTITTVENLKEESEVEDLIKKLVDG